MPNISRILACLMLLLVLAAPQLADARAGGGGSSGSRGSHSYSASPYGGQSLNRSAAMPSSPQYAPSSPSMPYNSGTSHPFLAGLGGGLMGAAIGHMLFGGMGGYGGGGMGILPLLLIGGIGYYLFKKLRSGAPGMMSSYSNVDGFGSANVIPIGGNNYGAQAAQLGAPFVPGEADKQAFEQLLLNVQQSWSSGDINRMRQYLTPEMVQYFSDELSANASRGVMNKVEQVSLQDAEISEAWTEYNTDYATAKLQFQAVDYMVRLDRQPGDADYIASGDNYTLAIATEFWTFLRATGGHWLLSAIQQKA